MYLSFLYKKIEYSGIALALLYQKGEVYLLYIDSNAIIRITKLKHLRKIQNLSKEEVNLEFLKTKLDKYATEVDLFSFEGRKFLEPIKLKYKDIISDFEKNRSKDENFSLKKYARI